MEWSKVSVFGFLLFAQIFYKSKNFVRNVDHPQKWCNDLQLENHYKDESNYHLLQYGLYNFIPQLCGSTRLLFDIAANNNQSNPNFVYKFRQTKSQISMGKTLQISQIIDNYCPRFEFPLNNNNNNVDIDKKTTCQNDDNNYSIDLADCFGQTRLRSQPLFEPGICFIDNNYDKN